MPVTIDKPSKYFNTVTYTGNGSTQSITGLEFSPDFTWLKHRNNATAYSHQLYDTVRGATNYLLSNTTAAENDGGSPLTTGLTSFNSDGFSLGSSVGINASGVNHVSWNWRGSDSSAVSNTSGTISSTVSANTTSGFSVCTYTGDGGTTTSSTIGHGLGVAPKIYFLKGRSEAGDWIVASSMFTNLQFLKLNLTNALASGGTAQYVMNSSTISVPARNTSGQTYVAYCFAEVKGFSKFSSFTGNGSFDGTFVYTGFKPAFVIIKCTDTARSWQIHNNKSDSFNKSGSTSTRLFSNLSDAEAANTDFDLLSNGFKVRGNDLNFNGSGNNYIYMAFAEQPLVGTNNIPATAR